jgi:hypothetical protein
MPWKQESILETALTTETRTREDESEPKPGKTIRSYPVANAKAQEYLEGFLHCQAIRRVLYSVDFVLDNGVILL